MWGVASEYVVGGWLLSWSCTLLRMSVPDLDDDITAPHHRPPTTAINRASPPGRKVVHRHRLTKARQSVRTSSVASRAGRRKPRLAILLIMDDEIISARCHSGCVLRAIGPWLCRVAALYTRRSSISIYFAISKHRLSEFWTRTSLQLQSPPLSSGNLHNYTMPPVALSSSPPSHSVLASNGQTYSLSGVVSGAADPSDNSYRGYDHVHWYVVDILAPIRILTVSQVGWKRQTGLSILRLPLRLQTTSLQRPRDRLALFRLPCHLQRNRHLCPHLPTPLLRIPRHQRGRPGKTARDVATSVKPRGCGEGRGV